MHAVTPHAWKLVLALALFAVMVVSARARAPRRATGRTDLRCLVVCALMLYGVGTAAWLTGHAELAALVYAAGIAVATLAAWLSRGVDAGGESPSDGHSDHDPPEGPSCGPELDWDRFEQAFREYADYAARPRTSAGVSG
jgi:hypothetical protein